jgi:hypothetical protein
MYNSLKIITSSSLATILMINQDCWPASAIEPKSLFSYRQSRRLKLIQRSPSRPIKIDYDSVAQDIVKLIEWLSLPDITPVSLTAKLQGSTCPKIPAPCDLVLINNRSNSVTRPLQALKNHSHIRGVLISLNQDNSNDIEEITIFFDELYQNKLSINALNQLISGGEPLSEPWSPRPGPSCDSACLSQFYHIAVNKKFLKNTRIGGSDYYIRARLFAAPAPLKFIGVIIKKPK